MLILSVRIWEIQRTLAITDSKSGLASVISVDKNPDLILENVVSSSKHDQTIHHEGKIYPVL